MTDHEQSILPGPASAGGSASDGGLPPKGERAGPFGPWVRVRAAARALAVTLLVALTLKTFVVEAFRIPSGSMENTLLVGDFLLVNKLAYGLKTPRYLPLTAKTIPSITLPAFGSVKRGDIVVFEYPGHEGAGSADQPVYFIKRCIGVPGDTLAIRSGAVTVNGREVLPPKYSKALDGMTLRGESNYGPLVVPKEGDTIDLAPETIGAWRVFIEREDHLVEIDPNGNVCVDGKRATRYRVERNYYFVLGDNRGNSLDSRAWGFVPEGSIIGEALLVYWSWNPELATGGVGERLENIRWDRVGSLIH